METKTAARKRRETKFERMHRVETARLHKLVNAYRDRYKLNPDFLRRVLMHLKVIASTEFHMDRVAMNEARGMRQKDLFCEE